MKILNGAKLYISNNGASLFVSSGQLTAEMRSPGTREDCDLAMHALAAEALQSPSDDGDLCSAPPDVEGLVVELELLPAVRESRAGVPRENAAEDGKRSTADAEVK